MEERWDCFLKRQVENKKVDKFLVDIVKVYKKHKLSLAHEDSQGSFLIEKISKDNIEWIKGASISKNYYD